MNTRYEEALRSDDRTERIRQAMLEYAIPSEGHPKLRCFLLSSLQGGLNSGPQLISDRTQPGSSKVEGAERKAFGIRTSFSITYWEQLAASSSQRLSLLEELTLGRLRLDCRESRHCPEINDESVGPGRIVEVPWRVAGDGRQRTIYARYELFGSRDLTVAVHVYEKWSCSPAGIVIGFRWDMNARLCGGEQDRRYECNIAWRE
ncbi:hypothetical protein K503DRAFT_785626 [Rhizopogon vinicolor AM-OR11-026]|uniref:Uncharacterized protein n=1 Tax=Rhizopogon vinicolor AM-OR11-026 TaxID=1314800 RepID=A0A1B7MPW0_9AGAM|nr:hypothetical protein K503DRAFT_785626 [Rhizopogon vinicolor AM-OR11-026]